MNNIKSKIMLRVIILIIAIGLLPIAANASELNEQVDTENKVITNTWINPMYKELYVDQPVILEDLKEDSITTFAVEKFCSSKEEAADFLRSQMAKRVTSISIKLNYSVGDAGIEIFELACANKDNYKSNEGDYIHAHLRMYSISYTGLGNMNQINYGIDYLTTYEQEVKVTNKVKEVLNSLNVYNADEYTKIQAVHDYIVKNINYDYSSNNHSAYNAIIDKSVVCQGYASLTYRLLRELGVGVRYITGIGNGGGHAWNIVRINNKWYNLDNTWDANYRQSRGYVGYGWFLKSNNDFPDHTRHTEYNTQSFNKTYPMATSSYQTPFEVAGVTLSRSSANMVLWEELMIKAAISPSTALNKKVYWTSSNEKVAFVDYYDGLIYAQGVGTAIITATTEDGNKKATVKITVTKNDYENHWGKEAIELGMAYRWVDFNNRFRPEDPVTRAEFIKLVNRAFGYTELGTISFTDVRKEYWYYDEVRIATKAGYITTANKTFRPNDTISREEVAVILTNIMNKRDNNLDKLSSYSDNNKVSSWAKASVEGAIEAGYMGKGSLEFRPLDRMVRAEAVAVLTRIK